MVDSSAEGEMSLYKVRAGFYRKIVERYSDAVNAGEEKTIPDLKNLVNPDDATVQGLRKEIEGGIQTGEYRFEKDFASYAEKAFNKVQSLLRIHSELSVSFWLYPSDILELGAADAFDRSILLCSLLIAGGCRNAKIRVLEVEGGARHPVVVYTFNERQHFLDPTQESSATTFTGSLEEIFSQYSYEGKKVTKSAFEFNNEEYNEFD